MTLSSSIFIFLFGMDQSVKELEAMVLEEKRAVAAAMRERMNAPKPAPNLCARRRRNLERTFETLSLSSRNQRAIRTPSLAETFTLMHPRMSSNASEAEWRGRGVNALLQCKEDLQVAIRNHARSSSTTVEARFTIDDALAVGETTMCTFWLRVSVTTAEYVLPTYELRGMARATFRCSSTSLKALVIYFAIDDLLGGIPRATTNDDDKPVKKKNLLLPLNLTRDLPLLSLL